MIFSEKRTKSALFRSKFTNPDHETRLNQECSNVKDFRGFGRRRNSNLPQFYHSTLRFSQIKDTVAKAAVFFLCPNRTMTKAPKGFEVFVIAWTFAIP
jgi:hypothetical protein